VNEPVEHRVGGRLRKGTRHELNLKSLVQQALAGDVKAAETLLKVREDAQGGELGIEKIQLTNWLPDYPGQTTEQKAAEHSNQVSIPPSGERDPSDGDSSK
jgi:hypothetical protein